MTESDSRWYGGSGVPCAEGETSVVLGPTVAQACCSAQVLNEGKDQFRAPGVESIRRLARGATPRHGSGRGY